MISDVELQQIMPKLPAAKRELYLPFLNHAMDEFEINTPLRAAAFLAQIAHESAEFRFMEEIWGPTPQQRRYEPPSTLATRLGNTQPGDGKRYKGRGPIQITGRANYRTYGQALNEDLEGNPDLAATPQIAFDTAGLYWKRNGLNELADVEDFIGITRRINGGTTGLPDRQRYYGVARRVLGVDVAVSRSASAARPAALNVAPEADLGPLPPPALTRGYEDISADSASSAPAKSGAKKKSGGATPRKAAKKVSAKKAAKKAVKKAAKPAKKAVKKAAKKVVAKKAAKKAVKKAAAKKPAKKARR